MSKSKFVYCIEILLLPLKLNKKVKSTKKRKVPPNKSLIKEAKKFLGYLLKKSPIPPTIQVKQRRKTNAPNKRLHHSLPSSNITNLKIVSKPNTKQSRQTITQKRINLAITFQGAKESLIIRTYTHHNNYYSFLR
jgi:hypothetical protein